MLNFKEAAIAVKAAYDEKKRAEIEALNIHINKQKELVNELVNCIERYGTVEESEGIISASIPKGSITKELLDSTNGLNGDDLMNAIDKKLELGYVNPKSLSMVIRGDIIEIEFKIDLY